MRPIAPDAVCAVHSAASASGTCARCGSFVCPQCLEPGGVFCAACRALGASDRRPPPWERRRRLGLYKAFVEQWKQSLFSPEKFWRALPAGGPVFDALLFAWLISLVQAVPAFLVQALNFDQVLKSLELFASLGGTGKSTWLESFSPWTWAAMFTLPLVVLYPLTFFISAGLTHVGCKLWGAGGKGFDATARVMGYAQGPMLLAWIPMVGTVAIIYLVVIQVIGVARVHETTPGKATAGVLTVPIAMGCCFVVVAIFAGAMVAQRMR